MVYYKTIEDAILENLVKIGVNQDVAWKWIRSKEKEIDRLESITYHPKNARINTKALYEMEVIKHETKYQSKRTGNVVKEAGTQVHI